MKRRQKLLFASIIFLACWLRLYGLNWDQNQHLHPDERFLTMVATSLRWPTTLSEYLNPQTSPLNPANAKFPFFVYGTFPLFLVKILAVFAGMDNYTDLTILGRAVSALFDIGTVILIFAIAKNLISKQTSRLKSQTPKKPKKPLDIRYYLDQLEIRSIRNFPYLASFFYAVSVLPIQLSHFFAVDTFLTFFITLSFYLLVKFFRFATNYNSLHQSTIPYSSTNAKKHSFLNRKPVFELAISPVLVGAAFGLALASKISALLFLPIILLAFFYISIQLSLPPSSRQAQKFAHRAKYVLRPLSTFLSSSIVFLTIAYFTFRLTNPYAFATANLLNPTPSPLLLQNIRQLQSWSTPATNFPPSIQWLNSKPLIFPLRNLLYYGLGLPLGLLAVGGVIYGVIIMAKLLIYQIANWRKSKHKFYYLSINRFSNLTISLITLWILFFFLYQGTRFPKPMRYFLPIYPFLGILASLYALQLSDKLNSILPTTLLCRKKTNDRMLFFCKLLLMVTTHLLTFALILLWPVAFLSIYSRPHSRVQASYWIYQHIPAGATLTCEHWDDCLPLPLSQGDALNLKKASPLNYTILQLPLYDPDTPEKWRTITDKLAQADYLILSSNRLYGSITSAPQRYPITAQFYQQLFSEQPLTPAGNLRFIKIAQFTSRPRLSIPFVNLCIALPFESYGKIAAQNSQTTRCSGLTIIDDYADESFTVYDHPKVIIFKKTKQ